MRGQADFSAAELLRGLEEFAPGVNAPPELSDYRRFYGFWSEVDHAIGTVDTGEHWLAVQLLAPPEPRGTVLVGHGYYDHFGLYVYLIEYLLSRGFAVLGFDLPGHGLSSGERVTIDSFDQYVQAAHAVWSQTETWDLPQPLHIAAQSLGGAVALEYLEQHELPTLEQVVLFAPLVRPYMWPTYKWVYALAKLMIKQQKRTITNNADNPEFIALQHADPLQAHVLPVQWVTAMVQWMARFEAYPPNKDRQLKIVQGHADRTVDWAYNLSVLERRYTVETLHLDAGRHHLVNERTDLRDAMWDWLDQQCGWRATR